MTNVLYWAAYSRNALALNVKTPQKIIHKNDNRDIPINTDFFKCPAFLNHFKSTFNVLSPIDYDLNWDGQGFYSKSLNQQFYNENIRERSVQHGLCGLKFAKYIFFTESESCIMSYGDAYFSNSSFTRNVSVICGQVDIAKWFRPTDLSFLFKDKPGYFVIKENDPLFSVNFNFGNNKPIILKKFMINDNLSNYVNHITSLKRYGFNLEKYKATEYFNEIYKIFNRSNIKHSILKEIKNNLME